MKRGIVIISLGNSYYARMAYQLAFSIKANNNIAITLVSNNHSTLSDDEKKHFNSIVDFSCNSNEYLKTKTKLYDLSPYDETLYLDADMIILKDLSPLFESLNDVVFTTAVRGRTHSKEWTAKTSMWGNLTQHKFDDAYWYQMSSEFIYFKKTKEVEQLFKDAVYYYENTEEFNKFANVMADEYAFGLACCKNNIYPHKEYFTPIYWAHSEKRMMREIDPYINENYYGYSMGGKISHPKQQAYYVNMLKYFQMKKNSRINIFIPKSKNYYMKERHTI